MKTRSKIVALFMTVVIVSGLMTFLSACGNGGGELVIPPPVDKVYSVTLQHNDMDVDGGMLTVELSAESVTLSADVRKDENADGTVTFSSSVPAVATIDSSSGVVTLINKGETVIAATAGSKKHEIILVVNDSRVIRPESHNITVNGGTANVTKAAEGDYVTLTANIPEHKDFTEWTFSQNVTWVNGNVFKMPKGDVEVTAVYDDMLYTLNLVGAKVSKADETSDPEGAEGGFTADGETEEYAITVYKLPFETEIDVEAIAEPHGKIFVGWDYGTQDNRAGEMGVPEYNFVMPDAVLTVWAVFSELKTKVLTAGGIAGFSTKQITNGHITGDDFPDAAMEGLSGYRITIPAGHTTGAGYTNENIQGSSLDTVADGSKTIKCIFRNNGTEAVTVETGAAYYGILASSGRVTINGGETKKVFFTAGMGINAPWMFFAVRENNSTTEIQLDMAVGSAPMYPHGDKLLSVTGGPEYVKIKDANNDFINKPYTSHGWMREQLVNNKVGATYIANYAHKGCYTTLEDEGSAYLTSPIVNMPEFNAGSPKTTIYGKYINLATNVENSLTTTIKVVVSTTNNPNESAVASFEITSDKSGELILFKLEFTRSAGQNYYFNIVKTQLDATGTYDANSFCLQLTYNNVMGYEEA